MDPQTRDIAGTQSPPHTPLPDSVWDAFELPDIERDASGALPSVAYVTFVMLNDNYVPGALTLAYSLRRQQTVAALVCLVSDGVSAKARQALELLFDLVLEVDLFHVPHARRQERQDRPYFFTRLNALRLGADGDLGCGFRKLVVIDADVLSLRRYDHLFTLLPPAGILNESKDHLIESDPAGSYACVDAGRATGKWVWHRLYDEVCPHGHVIPREITDRVKENPKNMGLNGSLFVLEPSMQEFEDIRRDVRGAEVERLVGDLFDWPDMQYLTMRWSGRWRNIDIRFSGLNGYPDLDVLCGTHFAGFKPWYFHREKTMARYCRYPDFQCWFEQYEGMVRAHPGLMQIGKLRRLLDSIRGLGR